MGALAASLAADPKWKSVDFHLVTEILKSHGGLTAEALALVGSGDTVPKVVTDELMVGHDDAFREPLTIIYTAGISAYGNDLDSIVSLAALCGDATARTAAAVSIYPAVTSACGKG